MNFVENKIVNVKALKLALIEELSEYSYQNRKYLKEIIDQFIVEHVEKPAFEEAGINYSSGDIEEVIENIHEFRDCGFDIVENIYDTHLINKKLIYVAEAILDPVIEEYLESNIESYKSVQQYAENGCDIYLSIDEAKQVLDVLKNWVSIRDSVNCSNDYYLTVKEPLLNY